MTERGAETDDSLQGQPTRQLRRSMVPSTGASTGAGPSTGGARASAPTVDLSRDALRDEEMGRVRVTAQVLIGMAVLGLVLTPMMGGDPFAKRVYVAGLLWAIVTMVFMLRNAMDAARYSFNFVGAASMALSVAATTSVYYMGTFSPAAMIGALGLYIFCLGGSLAWAIGLYAALALPHAVFAAGVGFGFMQDRGLVVASNLSLFDQIAVQACVQSVYAIAFITGRASRAKLEAVFADLENVARKVAQRDALLNEAKRELERAAWVGGAGRFTDQVVGSFRLGNVIGRGGMGEVYEATHLSTNEEAAVKLLQRNFFADPHTIARFSREAKAAAAMDSPHVVRVVEVPSEDSPIPYLAMERLRGEDLASMLRRERRLSSRDLARLLRQVGAGLDAAHASGVVHRDIKPQNIFLARKDEGSPTWKVLDFGVSKLLGQGSLTHDQLVGTPEYMSPEQASGRPVDHRTDLYALSAVLYRCLVSRAPYVGESLPALVHQVVHEMPPRPSSLARVSPDVEAVLAVGLAKDPNARFQSGRELAEAFRSALDGALSPELRERAARLVAGTAWEDRVRTSA